MVPSSVLRQGLRSLLCAPWRALNTNPYPAHNDILIFSWSLITHQRLIKSIGNHPALGCFLHYQWLMAIDNVDISLDLISACNYKDNH